MARLVRHVSTRDLRGASLLHAVHAATRCGDPDLESCALRLLWHCQGVVLRQLHAWCVHGQGPGESDEFFVRRVEDPVNGGDQPCAADWAAGFEVRIWGGREEWWVLEMGCGMHGKESAAW